MYGQLKSGGLGPPLCIPLCSGAGAPAAFLKRKPADGLGFQGGALGASWFRSERLIPNVFSVRRKKGAAHRSPAESDLVLYARTTRKHPVFPLTKKDNPCLGIPFLVPKKRGKEVSEDSPDPRGACRISLNENRSGPACLYQPGTGRGCGPRS